MTDITTTRRGHADPTVRPDPPKHERTWPLRRPDAGTVASVAIALFALTVGVGLFLVRILGESALLDGDAEVSRWFESVRTPTLNTLTDWGSAFSDTITIVLALVVLIPVLRFVTKRWDASLLLAGAVSLETLVFVTASLVVGRERPPVEQLDMSPPTASFPSGHTGAAVAFYIGLVILVFWWTRYRPSRILAVMTFGMVPVLVAVSRLYRGMHFPTDVLWGAVVGAASVALIAVLIARRREASDDIA